MSSVVALLVFTATACSSSPADKNDSTGTSSGKKGSSASRLVEGRDYIILERVRILDEMGFDQPVEAMSVLLPRGWKTEGGVRWKNVNECRGEIVTWQMKATSPDGQIEFLVLPARTFVTSQNSMIQQSLVAASQQGGCAVSAPFDATQYLTEFARTELHGATVSELRDDESFKATLAKLDEQANSISRQYNNGMRQHGTIVYGTLAWPDGKKGLANIGVSVTEQPGRDYYGAPNGFATTTVFQQVYIRYAPDHEAEALKLFGTVTTSHRTNPVWQQSKESFLTQLGDIEHAGRMERIRLMGEQSQAYAKAQSDASEARMRNWENKQASSDANQSRFIQTIREVETWKDSNGSAVELGAGYEHGWSRPDGSIILTNSSLFDPAVELQQNWSKMEKVKR
ncbi:MAG: hypothetical protein ABI120_01235 [Gemmatimonadaceae bacterium]